MASTSIEVKSLVTGIASLFYLHVRTGVQLTLCNCPSVMCRMEVPILDLVGLCFA